MSNKRLSVAIVAALLVPHSAGAQTATGSERVLRAFQDCRAVPGAEAQLACFRKAADALAAAVATKDIQIVDKSDVRKARRSLFGFALPRINLFGGGDDSGDTFEAFTEINTTVKSARVVANDRVEIRLADDNDAVWQTTDPMNFPPKPGAKIRIRKGAMGNYFLNVESRSYRGMRIR